MPLPPSRSLAGTVLEGGATYAVRAQAAGPLLQRYARVQNDAEKAATVEALNEVFRDIRFRHQPKDGLIVYYLEGRVIKCPASIQMHASLILKVRLDGKAVVEKDRGGATQPGYPSDGAARGAWRRHSSAIPLGGDRKRQGLDLSRDLVYDRIC